MNWTPEKIKAMSPSDRHTIWKRARTRQDEEAKKVVRMIEECGLPYSDDRCLTLDDPVTLKMYDIINSRDGIAAMIEATENGLPAIAGVDRRLNDALGVDYGGHNQATATAGSLIADCMHGQGYRNSGRKGKVGEGMVAKTAEIYVRNK
jgi:hypothetical protein